jgi:hypothetical protein
MCFRLNRMVERAAITDRRQREDRRMNQPRGRKFAGLNYRCGETRKRLLSLAAMAAAALVMMSAPGVSYALPVCATSISQCCKITSPGTYTIPSNFTANVTSGTCIDITVGGVSLGNANGNVTGPGSTTATTGVMVESTANKVIITGCFIFCSGGNYTGFGTGVQVQGKSAQVEFVGADGNGTGMRFTGPSPFVSGGASSNNANGIVLAPTATAPFLSVTADNNGATGIKLNGVVGGALYATANNNGQYGIWLNGATSIAVNNFIANSNVIAGVYLGCHSAGPSAAACPAGVGPTNQNQLFSSGSTTSTANSQKYGVAIDVANVLNRVYLVAAASNTIDDLYDGNPNCANNIWFFDSGTKLSSCIP